MSLRPRAASWFEALVLRDDLAAAIDVLARSARVELQSHGEVRPAAVPDEARDQLEAFDALEQRYGRYWPAERAHEECERCSPQAMLGAALARLQNWAEAAGPVVARLEALEREQDDLRLLQLLCRDTAVASQLAPLARPGSLLASCLYRLAPGQWPDALPDLVITQRFDVAEYSFLLALGLAKDIADLEQRLQLQKARPIRLPPELPDSAAAAADFVEQRRRAAAAEIDELGGELESLQREHDLAATIASVRFVRWYLDTVPDLSTTENFAWITGWTSDPDEKGLLRLLADANIKGLMRVASAPGGLEAPQVLQNPRWMRPFELFTGMLGVPGSDEADPTRIVAIVGPLMFGYMFGDVGHGAVLLAVGTLLSRRLPAMRLLAAGGAVSIVFGFLFGSVFAMEGIIEPLWLNPMRQPLPVIAVPMIGGAMLLLVGMTLDALQARWRRKAGLWFATDAGLLLCYLCLLGAAWQRWLLAGSLAGALWFIAGHGLASPRARLSAAGSAAVQLLETLMQLVVNTISFVRVGAFALAHAGLSQAVVGVADAAATLPGRISVLVVGNLLIVSLEGLVVGIQTTRLVLFEFFVRFMRAGGRPFRPISPARPVGPASKRRT